MLKLTFLGTSAGVPTKHRNVSSLAVDLQNPHNKSSTKTWLMVDCGEGTQHQILKTSLSLLDLQIICITHVHGDHCYGLAGVLASMAMLGRKQKLTIIAPKAIAKLLDTLTITTELHFPYIIDFIDIESILTNNNPQIIFNFNEQQICIRPIILSHRTKSYAFKICQIIQFYQLNIEKLQRLHIPPSNIWGQLKQGKNIILDNGQILLADNFVEHKSQQINMIVGGDNDNLDLLTNYISDIVLLVHEATYTQAIADKILQRQPSFNPQHSSAKQVACFAQKVSLPYLILTHFSSRFQLFDNVNDKTPNMGHIRAEVANHYQGQFWLAEDFQQYEVHQHRVIFTTKM